MDVAITGEHLITVDSDGFVSDVSWRDPAARPRTLARADAVLSATEGPLAEVAARLRRVGGPHGGLTFNGGLALAGTSLAVTVEQMRSDGYDWIPVGLLVLDIVTGDVTGWHWLPRRSRVVDGGLVLSSSARTTRIMRWAPPSG